MILHGASKPVLARRHPRVTGNSPLEMKISDIQAKQREGQSRIKELREKTKALEADGARKNTKPSKYNDFNAANSVQQL